MNLNFPAEENEALCSADEDKMETLQKELEDGRERRLYLVEEKMVGVGETMKILRKDLEDGKEECRCVTEEENVGVGENMEAMQKEVENAREEKKEKEEVKFGERDGLEIDDVVDKRERGKKRGKRRKEEGNGNFSGNEECKADGAGFMNYDVFSWREPRKSGLLAKEKIEKAVRNEDLYDSEVERKQRKNPKQKRRGHVGRKKCVKSEHSDSETVKLEKAEEKPKRGMKRKKKNEENDDNAVVDDKIKKKGSHARGRGRKISKQGEEEQGGEKNVEGAETSEKGDYSLRFKNVKTNGALKRKALKKIDENVI